MSNSVYLEVLDQSQDDNFIQELKSYSTKINESNARKFFDILFLRFDNKEKNSIIQAILSTIYEIISTNDEILQIFVQRNKFLDLPYTQKIFNREILNILHVVVDRHPKSITSDVENNLFIDKYLPELIQYEGKKSLLLLYMYTNKFKSLNEDQTKILELLVNKKCSDRFSSFDTAQYYVLLLSAAVERSESFRKRYIKKAWQIIKQVLTDYNEYINDNSDDNEEFINIINNCYLSLSQIEPYYNSDDFDFNLLYSHLQNEELQVTIKNLLLLIPFSDQPILENKDFIKDLLRFSQEKDSPIINILFDICLKSNAAVDYLSKEKSWLKYDHPYAHDTLRLFLVVKNRLKDRQVVLGKEFAIMLKKYLEENKKPAQVKVISVLLDNVKLNNEILDELNKDDYSFFQELIKRAVDRKNNYYFYCCALVANSINNVGYNDALLKFCPVIYKAVSFESRFFANICSVGKKLSKHEIVRNEFLKLKIQDVLKSKLNNENTKKYAKSFLKALRSNGEVPKDS
ncbi:hypothetical protein M9Y10_025649 [Tritrichomonas musculus]|uniref:Uncharacterized protein n=1 Tax=Tritrichomonas musculus TaxID=1915356 RepID=A0ABR2H991_9EUKA